MVGRRPVSAREFIEHVDLGDELRAHAAISSRPGQLDELEALADRADRYAAGWRAVLDEHRPIKTHGDRTICPVCASLAPGRTPPIDATDYPCPTVRALNAITDALGGEDA